MLTQQKNEKKVHFFEHQYLMNQCMFFAVFLMKCYPLDTQKPEPNVFDNSYNFHNGVYLDLHKKRVKYIFDFLKKQGQIVFWVYFWFRPCFKYWRILPENLKLIPCTDPEILMIKWWHVSQKAVG